MKKLLITAIFALLPYGAEAQDEHNFKPPLQANWAYNPTQTSLLLFVEGTFPQLKEERPGVYSQSIGGVGAVLHAELETPASEKTNLLVRFSVGRQKESVSPLMSFGRATLTAWDVRAGFGVRFLFGRPK